jgi:hypothetical protein
MLPYYHLRKNTLNFFDNFTKQKLEIGDKTLQNNPKTQQHHAKQAF